MCSKKTAFGQANCEKNPSRFCSSHFVLIWSFQSGFLAAQAVQIPNKQYLLNLFTYLSKSENLSKRLKNLRLFFGLLAYCSFLCCSCIDCFHQVKRCSIHEFVATQLKVVLWNIFVNNIQGVDKKSGLSNVKNNTLVILWRVLTLIKTMFEWLSGSLGMSYIDRRFCWRVCWRVFMKSLLPKFRENVCAYKSTFSSNLCAECEYVHHLIILIAYNWGQKDGIIL